MRLNPTFRNQERPEERRGSRAFVKYCATPRPGWIGDIYAGKINPRIASGLAPLLNLQLRAIKITDLERRLANLENKLSEEAGKRAKNDVAEQ
jgi:hypothetical protein